VWFLALICLGSIVYLGVDVNHRVDGYRIVQHGVRGTATVTRCTSGCVGDFVSGDKSVRLTGIRVNGADQPGVVKAAVSGAKATDAWTLTGTPWLHLSRDDLYAVAPLIAAMVIARLVLAGVRDGRSRR
jgi:hypothetical protein